MPRIPNTAMGAMRHQVVIQQATETGDGMGGQVRSWGEFATVWCAITPASGREVYQYGQVAASVSHTITMRHIAGVVPSMRVLYGTRVFAVNAVVNMGERDRFLRLAVTEHRAASADETVGTGREAV